MKTKIAITDIGTGSHASFEDGKLTVIQSGGCPIEDLLAGINLTQNDLDAIAEEVLDVWRKGYDGDEVENQLAVEVTRGEETSTARA